MMQPWRLIRTTDHARRLRIHGLVSGERERTAQVLGARAAKFLRPKVEGVLECAELFVVALGDGRGRHVFGRRTLPQMDLASVACAIQNLWLAARSEGLGMGPVPDFPDRPALEIDRWAVGRPLAEFVSENGWPDAAVATVGLPTCQP